MFLTKKYKLLPYFIAATAIQAATSYPISVVDSKILPGSSKNNYTDTSKSLGTSDNQYVSLGGPGAFIIVDFGAKTPILDGQGPDLEIREIGTKQSTGAEDERYRVSISNSALKSSFISIGEGEAVSLFDIGKAKLKNARYVLIEDLSTKTLTSNSPGSDIDSINAIHNFNSDALPGPSKPSLKLFNQGVAVSWLPPAGSSPTGYLIRRSVDGVIYSHKDNITLDSDELTFYDKNPLSVGDYYYTITSIYESKESNPTILEHKLPNTFSLPLETKIIHLGDDFVSNWANPNPQKNITFTFDLFNNPSITYIELQLELSEVSYTKNQVLLNDGFINLLPTTNGSTFTKHKLIIPSDQCQSGTNTIKITARSESGKSSGNLDDFMIKDIKLFIPIQ